MTNYIFPQPSTENMDRKKKKPAMEKQRRDRMNKALEDLKVIIIRHDPNHTSKLEKADILERTLGFMQLFENQLAQIPHIQQQTTANTITAIFNGLQRAKAQPETFKAVENVVMSLFPHRPQPPPPPQLPSIPTPPFNFNQPMSKQMLHPNLTFFPPTMNPLLFPQINPQFCLFNGKQPAQPTPSTPKASSAPIMIPTSSAGVSIIVNKPETTSPSKVESRPYSRTETLSTEDEDEIDIEKVDEHDETFSPEPSPQQRRGTKRSRSSSFLSSTNEDSGISEGSPHPKKANFSIDGILK